MVVPALVQTVGDMSHRSRPVTTSNSIIEIPLTQGFVTLIDQADADLASLKWHVQPNNCGRYYATRNESRTVGGKFILLHRVILERMLGHEIGKSYDVDHIDGNSLNNRRGNLRIATRSQNNFNASKRDGVSSRFKGVCWDASRGRWMAYINAYGKRRYLGRYDTEAEAYEVYCREARILFGEYARLD